eukprot:jgi/Botrbrau1/9672/Bobra.0201s0006.1
MHLLSGNWPLEDESSKNIADGGTKSGGGVCDDCRHSKRRARVVGYTYRDTALSSTWAFYDDTTGVEINASKQSPLPHLHLRDKESLQQANRDFVGVNWSMEQKDTRLSSLLSLGPMDSLTDLPQSPFQEEAAAGGDNGYVRASQNMAANQLQGLVVKGRVRNLDQPFYMPLRGVEIHPQPALYHPKDFVDEMLSPRQRHFQELNEQLRSRLAFAPGLPDPRASPASLSSGRTTFDSEGACTPAPLAVTSTKNNDTVNEASQNLEQEALEDPLEDSGAIAMTSGAANVRLIKAEKAQPDHINERRCTASADLQSKPVFRRPFTRSAGQGGPCRLGVSKGLPQKQQRVVANKAATGKVRSSKYRGVTKHRRSGRWEAHVWVKELGRQVYLGGYEQEEHAAEAYDVAILKCKGRRVSTNFEIARYADLLDCMDAISLEELIMAVRRQSQGFARGTSSFRGVTRHPSGRWEARIGIPGSKHIYLGLFQSEEEAARSYDAALVRLRGSSAATNFALSDYTGDLAAYHKMQQSVLGVSLFDSSGAASDTAILSRILGVFLKGTASPILTSGQQKLWCSPRLILQSSAAAKLLDSRGSHFENWIKHGTPPEEGVVVEPAAVVKPSSARPQRRAAAARFLLKNEEMADWDDSGEENEGPATSRRG